MINNPNELKGMKCLLFGYGRSNAALAEFLAEKGAEITVFDSKKSISDIEEQISKQQLDNVKAVKDLKDIKHDVIFRTPSVRPDSPEITGLLSNHKALLSSETELFFDLVKGKVIGITGSDGKTTTTTLTYKILKEKYGDAVKVGGNIGIPLISLLKDNDKSSITVCELSSFQLMTLKRSPDVAAITNITENHLDYHKNMEEYIRSKLHISESQECKKLVIGADSLSSYKKYFSHIPEQVVKFSPYPSENGVYITNGCICYDSERVLETEKIKVKGKHNRLNYMTAIGICYPDVTKENISAVAESFGGVEHRAEFVADIEGISFYNSSIDSTPSRTMATLDSFDEKNITLICGGKDKNLSFETFAEKSQEKVKNYIIFGSDKEKINIALKNAGVKQEKIFIAETLEKAVQTAVTCTKKGGIVLLSPASTSFDMYENFEQRGSEFKRLVKALT